MIQCFLVQPFRIAYLVMSAAQKQKDLGKDLTNWLSLYYCIIVNQVFHFYRKPRVNCHRYLVIKIWKTKRKSWKIVCIETFPCLLRPLRTCFWTTLAHLYWQDKSQFSTNQVSLFGERISFCTQGNMKHREPIVSFTQIFSTHKVGCLHL